MSVACYIRVSTREQLEGFGLDVQRDFLTNYIKENGYNLETVRFYEDAGYSASKSNRPAFKQLVKDVKNNKIKTILIYKLDRMFRNLLQQHQTFAIFDQHQCELICALEPINRDRAEGRMMLNIKGTFAEYELDIDRERSFDGQLSSAKKGNYALSNCPIGYDKINMKLQINDDAKYIREMFELLEKKYSLQLVATLLNGQQEKINFTESLVRKLKRNKIYYGCFELYGFSFENHSPAIISKDLFDKVNSSQRFSISKNHCYLFSGLIYLAETGEKLILASGTSKSGNLYYYYKVKKTKLHNQKYIGEKTLVEAFNLVYAKASNEMGNKQFYVKFQYNTLQRKIEEVINLFSVNEISTDLLVATLQELDKKKQHYKNKIEQLSKKRKMVFIDDNSNFETNETILRDIILKIEYSINSHSFLFYFMNGKCYNFDINTKTIKKC